ncbi:MAG TPA: hypothetical protein DCZ94_04490 [Lentisphaeria bacterium]|nr:MAG: hypothetical protein A2X48_20280 [Lentisphaerae bacterium GWF2_49_21]HBC86195.1 hypothetical protein [Lentisphaeria bacterium]
MTSPQTLENLFFEAADSDSQETLDALLSGLAALPGLVSGDAPEHISLLLEHWGDSVEDSIRKSLFSYRLCELAPPDSQMLRNTLYKALKKTIPQDVSRNAAASALGLKDPESAPATIALKFRRLQLLKEGLCFFSEKENKWGIVTSIDPLTGAIHVKDAPAGKKAYPVSLGKLLSEFIPFKDGNEMLKGLASSAKNGKTDRGEWIALLNKHTLLPLSEAQIDKIAFFTLLPDVLTLDQFNTWWKAAEAAGANTAEKDISSARNIKELHTILSGMIAKSMKIGLLTESERKKIGECLSKLKETPGMQEQILFAETLSLLISVGCKPQDISGITVNLKGRVSFWPEKLENASREKLALWDEIPYEHIPNLLEITAAVFSKEYIGSLMMKLPYRAMNASTGPMEYAKLGRLENLTADLLLHMWKNRNSVPGNILSKLTFRNIFHALSDNEEMSWPSSIKELKKILIENQELQKYLLELHSENEEGIFEAIRINKALSQYEIQSLLAKMSRLSPDFKKFLEKNQGRGAVNIQKTDKSADTPIPVTSMKSYNQRIKEFEDIINKHLPENTAAISHARGFGDLRENAEYSAAKERQRFLNRRKAELEQDLANVIPFNFEKIESSEFARIGTTVVLDINGTMETYHIVGLWDSDPERNMLSSDSRFSKAVVSKRTGDPVILPDGNTAKVISIKSLPEDIIGELNNEHMHN